MLSQGVRDATSIGLQFRKAIWIVLAIGALSTATAIFLASRVKLAGDEITPSGLRRNTSHYVTMRDGTRIAVDLWLPPDYRSGERLPVLMRNTIYWRAIQPRFGLRMMVLLHLKQADALVNANDEYLNRRGFVVVVSDMRGSGASEGKLDWIYSQDEIRDLGDLAEWAAAQPWSNGRIGEYGISYDGTLAELSAASGAPAVKAVVSLYGDFDTIQGWVRPGGLYDRGLVERWSQLISEFDRNDSCGIAGVSGWRCLLHQFAYGGVKPTDEDPEGRRLAAIVADRENPSLAKLLASEEFQDDSFPTRQGPIHPAQVMPYGLKEQFARSQASMMVWNGWMDASPDGALNGYRNLSISQIVVLGALSHGGEHGTDPLLGNFDRPSPSSAEQWRMQADFLEEILRPGLQTRIEPHIEYYTMGEGLWHRTETWPPAGLKLQRLYFGADGKLAGSTPNEAAAADAYRADYDPTSGVHSRWMAPFNGGYVSYPDRASQDAKSLTYTSDPLPVDTEITGSPCLTLELSSSARDGAIFAYLEDVAPDGTVTYVTEGILRLIHRKPVSGQLPYLPLGPEHTYLRSDAAPMEPDQPAHFEMGMFAASVLLHRGHRIRVALAAADRDNFESISEGKSARWVVYRDRERPSFIELPVRPR